MATPVPGIVARMKVKDALGRFGEDLAAEHLRRQGLTLLARNWRCDQGELDIIARDRRTLVFVEVKTRSTLAYGDPAEAVTTTKAQRIHRVALRWLTEHRDELGGGPAPLRFDVVCVVRRGPDGPQLRHLRGAF